MTDSTVSEKEGQTVTPTQDKVTPAAAPRSGSRTKLLVTLVFLLVAGVAVYWLYMHFRDRVSSDDANVDAHISAIAPKITGNVVEVAVLDNQQVKAGDVLVRIDPRDYQAAVDVAKAALAQAQGQLQAANVSVPWVSSTTESGTSVADAQLADAQTEVERARAAYDQANTSDVAYAQANVASKQANNDRAQADLARMKPLVDKAEISQQQYDSYVASAKVADSDLQAAREKLGSAQKDATIRKAALDSALSKVNTAKAQVASTQANRKQVAVRTADAASARAAVEAAQARLDAAELTLSYTTVTAPVSGTVTRKSVEVGQMVQPGQGLMTVITPDIWVTANFKETQLADVKPGQKAEIQVDMYGKSVIGHVDSIADATGSRMSLLPPENATGNFVKVVQRIPVKILVDETNGLVLRPGMNVDVTIFTR
ncbi:MAG TPA: HlyD family secretion protein [Bryobacteraceae bacterium]|jgi:membrane fusion protein (multidrug efflux system)|nr:HlyD family secretion protein [Bryobacteraceae bacterium]